MSGEVFIAGHSLGGQRAWQYAYSRIKRGLRVDGVYALAPSQPGDKAIGQIMWAARAGMTVRSLKNGRDYVPSLPISIKLIGEEFCQPWPMDEINETVDMTLDADPYHHISNYVAGAKTIPDNPGVAITLGDAADQIALLYQTDQGWDWISPVDGAYWAMRRFPNGAKLMIPRGSATPLDFLLDFDASEILVQGAKMPRGGWSGVAAIESQLDEVLAT
jgi:pimeloyl-ACP methyl ester carboxylesterase